MDMGIFEFKGVRYKEQEQFIEVFFSDWGLKIKIGHVGILYKIMDGQYVKF